MNIIEAIKSGKRFKRKGSIEYYDNRKDSLYFVIDEVMADDWEVEPDAVTITREKFNAAWDKGLEAHRSYIELHAIICKELGF